MIFGLIEKWIDKTNHSYVGDRVSCAKFEGVLKGYFPQSVLESSFYVVVDKVPFPNIPMVKQAMSGGAVGITYKDTYYLVPSVADDPNVHFHELVHVLQWRFLGAKPFIRRYLSEIVLYGYQRAPLEVMAYSLQQEFARGNESLNIQSCTESYLG